MGKVELPNDLTEHTDALADEVMANYEAITDEVNGNLDEENLADLILARLHSPGDLKATALAAPPSNWLLCDGSAVSRETYAELFAAIGTTYGVGNGATTFNVPDLRGRVAVGVDGAAGRLSANDSLGKSGGAEKHTLVTSELPSHNHGPGSQETGAESALHTHNIAITAVQRHEGTGFAYNAMVPGGATATGTESANHVHAVDFGTTDSTGGGQGHNNMQPYQVVNWVIYAGA